MFPCLQRDYLNHCHKLQRFASMTNIEFYHRSWGVSKTMFSIPVVDGELCFFITPMQRGDDTSVCSQHIRTRNVMFSQRVKRTRIVVLAARGQPSTRLPRGRLVDTRFLQ